MKKSSVFRDLREVELPDNLASYQFLKGLEYALVLVEECLPLVKGDCYEKGRGRIESIVRKASRRGYSFFSGTPFVFLLPGNWRISWSFENLLLPGGQKPDLVDDLPRKIRRNREKLFVLKLIYKLHYLIPREEEESNAFVLELLKLIRHYTELLINDFPGDKELYRQIILFLENEVQAHIKENRQLEALNLPTLKTSSPGDEELRYHSLLNLQIGAVQKMITAKGE